MRAQTERKFAIADATGFPQFVLPTHWDDYYVHAVLITKLHANWRSSLEIAIHVNGLGAQQNELLRLWPSSFLERPDVCLWLFVQFDSDEEIEEQFR